MDEKKKCILENELQTLLERLEAGNYEVTATNIPLVMEAVKPHSLDKAHSYLASLSLRSAFSCFMSTRVWFKI